MKRGFYGMRLGDDDDAPGDSGAMSSESSSSASSDSSASYAPSEPASSGSDFTPNWDQPTQNSTVAEAGGSVPYYLAPNNADGSTPTFTTPSIPAVPGMPPPAQNSAGYAPAPLVSLPAATGAGVGSSFLPGLMNIFGQSSAPSFVVPVAASGTPSWVIPVAIGAVGIVGLVIFVIASRPSAAPVAGYRRRRSR